MIYVGSIYRCTSSYPCSTSRPSSPSSCSSSSSSHPSFASFPPSLSSFRPPSPQPFTLLHLLVISLPSSSYPCSSTHCCVALVPPHRLSSSLSTLLLFNSPPLGTCCHLVRLLAMCCHCRSCYHPRCRCRHHCLFAGIASSGSHVIVAVTVWVVDAIWGLISSGVGGGVGNERKTGYDKCHSPFLRCTGWQTRTMTNVVAHVS